MLLNILVVVYFLQSLKAVIALLYLTIRHKTQQPRSIYVINCVSANNIDACLMWFPLIIKALQTPFPRKVVRLVDFL